MNSIRNGEVSVSSLLFGQKKFRVSSQISAILLRAPEVVDGPYWVITKSGSRLRARSLVAEKANLGVDEPILGKLTIPQNSLLEMRFHGIAPESHEE